MSQSKICEATLELVKSVYLTDRFYKDKEVGYKDYIQEVIKSSENIPPNIVRIDYKIQLDSNNKKCWRLLKETEYAISTSGDLVYVQSFEY